MASLAQLFDVLLDERFAIVIFALGALFLIISLIKHISFDIAPIGRMILASLGFVMMLFGLFGGLIDISDDDISDEIIPTNTLFRDSPPFPSPRPSLPAITATSPSNGCFCSFYTNPDDPYSLCPGTAISSGTYIPPSSIVQPNSSSNELWVYFNGGTVTSGGIWWEYKTEMYDRGEPASRACVENQIQYFSGRTPIYK